MEPGYALASLSNAQKPPDASAAPWVLVATFAPTEQGRLLRQLWADHSLQRTFAKNADGSWPDLGCKLGTPRHSRLAQDTSTILAVPSKARARAKASPHTSLPLAESDPAQRGQRLELPRRKFEDLRVMPLGFTPCVSLLRQHPDLSQPQCGAGLVRPRGTGLALSPSPAPVSSGLPAAPRPSCVLVGRPVSWPRLSCLPPLACLSYPEQEAGNPAWLQRWARWSGATICSAHASEYRSYLVFEKLVL